MDAHEARKVAYGKNVDSVGSQYEQIQQQIKKAAAEGKYKTFIYEHPLSDVRNKLSLQGFTIGKDQGKYNEVCIPISW